MPKIKKIIEQKFYEDWQKDLSRISEEAVNEHFEKNLPVHEQVGDTIYQVFSNGEKRTVKTVGEEE